MLRFPFVVGSLLLLALTGCAQVTGAASGSAPTAACPSPVDQPAPATCAVYDPQKSMDQNNAYKIRMPLDGAEQSRLEKYVGPVRAGLKKLTASGAPITSSSVGAVLAANGLTEAMQDTVSGSSLSFAVVNGRGCIFGGITGSRIDVAAGGFVPDGGCLVIEGH